MLRCFWLGRIIQNLTPIFLFYLKFIVYIGLHCIFQILVFCGISGEVKIKKYFSIH